MCLRLPLVRPRGSRLAPHGAKSSIYPSVSGPLSALFARPAARSPTWATPNRREGRHVRNGPPGSPRACDRRVPRTLRRPKRAVVCSRTRGRVNAKRRPGSTRDSGAIREGRLVGAPVVTQDGAARRRGRSQSSRRLVPRARNFPPPLSENDPMHCQSMIYPITYTLSVGCLPITNRGGPRRRTVIFHIL